MTTIVTPPTAHEYPFHVAETLRFADTDRHGHITNSVFAICCQTGRIALLEDPGRPLAPFGTQFVLARIEIDFRHELHWPGTVDIGTRIARVGRSSLTLEQALFQNGRCVATAHSVAVLTDSTTRRSTALPEAIAELVHALSKTGSSAPAAVSATVDLT